MRPFEHRVPGLPPCRHLSLIGLLVACAPTRPDPDPRLAEAQGRIAAREIAEADFQYGGFSLLVGGAVDEAMATMRPALESELGRELTRSEDAKLQRIVEGTVSRVFPEEVWIDAFERIYLRFFSNAELRAIASFYRTPAGRQLVRLNSTLVAEAEKVARNLYESREQQFEDVFIAEFEETFGDGMAGETASTASRALTIAEAIEACRAVQADAQIPISCATEYFQGKPTMVVGFPRMDDADAYWSAMAEEVTEPFCGPANAASRQAFVLVALLDTEAGRLFACETGDWSDWFTLAE